MIVELWFFISIKVFFLRDWVNEELSFWLVINMLVLLFVILCILNIGICVFINLFMWYIGFKGVDFIMLNGIIE